MVQFLKKRWVYHCLIWVFAYLLFVLMEYLAEDTTGSMSSFLTAPFSFLISVMPMTYLAFWAKEKFFDNRKYILYIFGTITFALIGVLLRDTFDLGLGKIRIPRSDSMINYISIQVFAVGFQ